MHYNFIEIGTADFRVMAYSMADGDRGMSIDPFPPYYEKLPDRENLIRLNCAVSNREGVADLYYLPPEVIEAHKMNKDLTGCMCLNSPHPSCLKHLKKHNLPTSLIEHMEVPIVTFKHLIDSYDVTSIDVLKIDTEGHDNIILLAAFKMFMENDELWPRLIQFEHAHITTSAKNHLMKIFKTQGYRSRRTGPDIMLTRDEL